jgi:8-oxo-dGTP pyrophosphatase MutT (NUDIX family)
MQDNQAIPTEKIVRFRLKTMPPIFRRGEHVLILLRNKDGKFVLGEKNLYPEGIVRMVGGGMDGDTPPVGASREMAEELGITVEPDDLTFLMSVKAEITADSEMVHFTTHLFFYQLSDEVLHASDDLDGLAHLSEAEYFELIKRYSELSEDIDPTKQFAWADYGKVYGPMHQWALEASKSV